VFWSKGRTDISSTFNALMHSPPKITDIKKDMIAAETVSIISFSVFYSTLLSDSAMFTFSSFGRIRLFAITANTIVTTNAIR